MDPATSLPTGTVTFLFTDIEGSTRLWEQQPEAMREALAQHDTLLRTAIHSHSGYVFKTVGDAFCAVFTDASRATRAAVEAQWPSRLTVGGWRRPATMAPSSCGTSARSRKWLP